MEQMVPQDHLLRQIDTAIDFNKVYEFVEELYCKDNGRPSIDPVVLFKIVLIQHIYGIRSLRRTLEEIGMNMNLKKLATWKWKRKNPSPGKRRREIFSMDFLSALIFFPFKMKKSVLA